MDSKIKEQKKQSRKAIKEIKDVIKHMEGYVNSDNEKAIMLAHSFFHVLTYHMKEGDLEPKNVHLTALLRRGIK
jgi:hypothetical protein